MRIAMLGTGEMGSRMAQRLLRAGHELVVWNRTPGRTQPLVVQGATHAASPRQAVEGCDVALSMVRDDDASRTVWLDPAEGAFSALPPGAIAIETSTLSVEWVRQLSDQATMRGLRFLDAPVVGSRSQADAGMLIYLVGGRAEHVSAANHMFAATGSRVHHVGPSGNGAALKLIVNALFAVQVATVAELLGVARQRFHGLGDVVDILSTLPVCSAAAAAAARAMVEENYAPAFPVELALKDLRLLRQPLVPVCQATELVYAAAVNQGLSSDNLTAVAKLYLRLTD